MQTQREHGEKYVDYNRIDMYLLFRRTLNQETTKKTSIFISLIISFGNIRSQTRVLLRQCYDRSITIQYYGSIPFSQ